MTVVKPFWVRFSEGLADLAVHLIELKAKQRWPRLSNATYEIVAKQSADNGDDGGQGNAKDGTCIASPPGYVAPEEKMAPDGTDGSQPDDGGWAVPR